MLSRAFASQALETSAGFVAIFVTDKEVAVVTYSDVCIGVGLKKVKKVTKLSLSSRNFPTR